MTELEAHELIAHIEDEHTERKKRGMASISKHFQDISLHFQTKVEET